MAQGSSLAERFVREVTPGLTPVDSTEWKVLPVSGTGGISATPAKSESTRVRSDGGRSAGSVVAFDINGAYSAFDFKADQVDDYFEMVCANTFTAGVLTNARSLQTATVERQLTDLTNKYLKYRGATVSQLVMNFAQVRERVTLAPTFIAMTHDSDDVASDVGAGSVEVETTNRALTVLDLQNLSLGGTLGYCVSNGSITLNHNVTAKECAGNQNAVDLELGQFELSGNLEIDTTDNSWALLANRDAGDTIALTFDLTDGVTTYSFDIPDVQVEFPDPSAVAANDSILLSIDIQGYQEDGSHTIQITKA